MNDLVEYLERLKEENRALSYTYITHLVLAIPNNMERLFAISYVELELKTQLKYRPGLSEILSDLRQGVLNDTKTN